MKKKQNMFVFLVQAAWRYAGPARPRMVLFYAMFFCANLFIAVQPLVMAQIINTIQAASSNAFRLTLEWAALYGTLTVCFWLIHGPARVIERRVAYIAYRAFVADLYRMVTDMPLRWHQDHHSGGTINRVNKAARALFSFGQEEFIVIQMTVRFSMAMILLSLYSVWVMAASLFISCVLTLLIRRFDKTLVPLIESENDVEHKLNATLFDYISNIITVVTLRLQGNTRAEVDDRVAVLKPFFWREVVVNEWKWGTVNILLVMTQAGIVGSYIALHEWRHEALAVGTVVAIFQYLLMISQVFYDGATVYARLMQRHTDIRTVDSLIEDHARLVQAKPVAPPQWHSIQISQLNFTHHEGEDVLHHLAGIDLTIKAGQKIALIGSSGSGKTTLLTLLRGLYEAPGAKLNIDGIAYEGLAPLSGFTTLVPQDSEIFENTVRYNLTLGTQVSDEILQQALSITTFDDVAPKLPEGIETDIRERGVNLSGGQKQRLALARGLIAARNSSLLLLDEPTSSVDLPTEGIILDRLFDVFRDKAIIASIHRLHLLPRFDVIGLMRDGRMVELGAFNDLLQKRGAFCDLWQHHLAHNTGSESGGESEGVTV
jgi:ABC-type multidrug transport system fused ATPase/permease subunit